VRGLLSIIMGEEGAGVAGGGGRGDGGDANNVSSVSQSYNSCIPLKITFVGIQLL
jgi:hypothetical protein